MKTIIYNRYQLERDVDSNDRYFMVNLNLPTIGGYAEVGWIEKSWNEDDFRRKSKAKFKIPFEILSVKEYSREDYKNMNPASNLNKYE